jgi:phosphatidylglycerol:prolipoprotein diacylglycerol transferase
MFAIVFPNISPYYLEIYNIQLRWYGLVYALSLFLAPYILVKLMEIKKIDNLIQDKNKFRDKIILAASLGVLIGGRLGYAVFYNHSLYLNNPLNLLRIWEGGMAFHGAIIGLTIALYYVARSESVPVIVLLDLVCCMVPTALFFGRLTNFLNAELYGRPTDVPWAVIFPYSDGLPRHPSQLYEAGLEGWLLQIIVAFVFVRYWGNNKQNMRYGLISGVFCIFYGIFRIFSEFFRQPEIIIWFTKQGAFWLEISELEQLNDYGYSVTLGQALSIPMVIAGGILVFLAMKQRR